MEKIKHVIVFESDNEDYQKIILDFLTSLDLKPRYEATIPINE